jgi:hypothetical protein
MAASLGVKELIVWSSELVVRELPGGKNVSTEAEDICSDP